MPYATPFFSLGAASFNMLSSGGMRTPTNINSAPIPQLGSTWR